MNEFVLYALLALTCISLLLVILLLSKSNNGQGLQNEMAILQSKIAQLEHSIKTDFSINRTEINNRLQSGFDGLIQKTDANHKLNRDDLRTGLLDLTQELKNKFTDLTEGQSKLVQQTEKKLEQMRETVDEKLQKTLNERLGQSFEAVGKQLEAVQLGLGEMKTLANDVGGLKKVLSNVKMRGGIGEVQLAMLLEQILAPEQYAANVKTKQNSADIVEFAIKLPGRDDNNKQVWLPIDAKFPKDVYEQLQTAYDASDLPEIEVAQKNLEQTIKKMAKDISDKYLDPPNTTDFAILFLPFEGIYAEVVRKASLLDDLQRNYKIIVTGPSTLAAILNSLQMGFKTLAIQKRSGEVWKVLGNVKTEFEKFGGLIEKAQGNIQNGLKQLDEVVGVRTRSIQRQLRDVEVLNDAPGAFND
ncbi:MAG: DNA recombination protein RmuC [Sediminibacterium sp.]